MDKLDKKMWKIIAKWLGMDVEKVIRDNSRMGVFDRRVIAGKFKKRFKVKVSRRKIERWQRPKKLINYVQFQMLKEQASGLRDAIKVSKLLREGIDVSEISREIIAKTLSESSHRKYTVDEITPDKPFSNFGASSNDIIKIILNAEKEFNKLGFALVMPHDTNLKRRAVQDFINNVGYFLDTREERTSAIRL